MAKGAGLGRHVAAGSISVPTEKSSEENQEGVIEVLVEVDYWRP